MKLTNAEKLILAMLSEIHIKLGITGGVDAVLVDKALYSNNMWALSWELAGTLGFETEPEPAEVTEVSSILEMWSFLENGLNKLSTAEKKEIEAAGFQPERDLVFPGFDGNQEATHRSIAKFITNELYNRFEIFKGRDLNSHRPTLTVYRRMLIAFDPIRNNLKNRTALSCSEIIFILKSAET